MIKNKVVDEALEEMGADVVSVGDTMRNGDCLVKGRRRCDGQIVMYVVGATGSIFVQVPESGGLGF